MGLRAGQPEAQARRLCEQEKAAANHVVKGVRVMGYLT